MKKSIIIIFAVSLAHILFLVFLGQSFAEEETYFVNILVAIIGAVGLLLCFILSVIKRKELNKTNIFLLLLIFSVITLFSGIAWRISYNMFSGLIEKLCGVDIVIGLSVLAVIPPNGIKEAKGHHKALIIAIAASASVLLIMFIMEFLFRTLYYAIPMYYLYSFIAEAFTIFASAVLFVSRKKNKL